MPTTVRNTNTACQPKCTSSKPPIIGATAGATPKNRVTCDITRCASAGGNMSRMMARDTTMLAPELMPCASRHSTSWPTDCDIAQPSDDSAKMAVPHSTTGRRPKLSDSAPWNRFITAKPNRYADRVCCICTGVAPSDCAMPENAGR